MLNHRKPTMQTDNTPISTYILIDTNNNKQISKVKMSQREFLNKNYAYGLNHSQYRYIKQD
jgi:hypothetical protein